MLSNPQSLKRKGDAGASASQVWRQFGPYRTPIPSARSPDRQGGGGGKIGGADVATRPPRSRFYFFIFALFFWAFLDRIAPKYREMPSLYFGVPYYFATVVWGK